MAKCSESGSTIPLLPTLPTLPTLCLFQQALCIATSFLIKILSQKSSDCKERSHPANKAGLRSLLAML
ncbi:MAG: hypothetical protein F6J93_36910 [Oscillatoria sp. SIO1A7]|nr:hypothetical protein [Oscillatoria sp. SIO1A7]